MSEFYTFSDNKNQAKNRKKLGGNKNQVSGKHFLEYSERVGVNSSREKKYGTIVIGSFLSSRPNLFRLMAWGPELPQDDSHTLTICLDIPVVI